VVGVLRQRLWFLGAELLLLISIPTAGGILNYICITLPTGAAK